MHTVSERADYRLEFPRVVQIVSDVGETLTVDIDAIEPIRVSAEFDPTETWMEFEAGSPGQGLGLEIHDREVAYERFRMQRLLFRVAAEVIEPFAKPWLFPDALKIVQRAIEERVVLKTISGLPSASNLRGTVSQTGVRSFICSSITCTLPTSTRIRGSGRCMCPRGRCSRWRQPSRRQGC